MKRRNSKKTGVIALIAGLSSVTLVSIGFASWVISGGDKAVITDGTISVDEVDDGRYLIAKTGTYAPAVSYGEDDTGSSIVYGAPANSTTGWLTNNSTTKVNLIAKVTFYVANLTGKTIGTDYSISGTIEASGEHAQAFNDAIRDNLVALPTITENTSFVVDNSGTHPSDTIGTTEYTFTKVTLSLKFKWGTYFGDNSGDSFGVNPYDFYKTKNSDDYVNSVSGPTWSDDAKSKLEEIHLANGASFKVTLTTTSLK